MSPLHPHFSELDLLGSPLEPGLTVIEASAGTGKTYSISHLVPRLLLEGALPDLSQLLLVTFTKDAARELAERVRRVLGLLAAPAGPDEARALPHVAALRGLLVDPAAQARLDRALVDLDLLSVSTIHAFCQRTLQQEGSLCGLPVLPAVTTDDSVQLEPIVRDRWIAALSADPDLATLATAQGWKLDSVLRLIRELRRCVRPQAEPAVAPLAELRGRWTAFGVTLASPTLIAGICALIGRVTAWNQGYRDAAHVLEKLQPLLIGETGTLAFWQTVAVAGKLPELIQVRTAEGKDLRKQVEAHPWWLAVSGLVALTETLEWAWQHELAAHALPQLEAAMARHRLITQDGLIGALYRGLHRSGEVGEAQSDRLAARLAERYQVAIIDESQDTDPRQFAIFQRVFLDPRHRRRLILVGDPKQAIYGFRGANVATYLAARAGADAGYTLTRTHRAPAPLVETVNRLFRRAGAFHHPEMRFDPAVSALDYDRRLWRDGVPCSRLETWIVPDEDGGTYRAAGRRIPALSARVAGTIVDLLQHGEFRTCFHDGRPEQVARVTPRDFAVLVATNAQANTMAEALQLRAVPVVVNSGSDVFSSDEARELHTLLQALLEPRRTRRLRTALATRLIGLDAAALTALDQPTPDGETRASVWLARFSRWNQLWLTRGLAALLADWEHSDVAVTHRLALVPLTGERRATNFRHLTDLLLEAARDLAPRPAETVRWLGQQIARAEERSQVDERQLQLASDREAVQIVTMHKAKGLEYPLVFCPYLADTLKDAGSLAQIAAPPGRVAEPRHDVLVNLDLLEAEAKGERGREVIAANLEERLRLAYVALTRAQVRVWLCSYSGAPRSDFGSPLDWLLRTDDEVNTYPHYSPEWVKGAKAGRGARHAAVLQTLEGVVIAPEAEATLITISAPPEVAAARFIPDSALTDVGRMEGALAVPFVPASWRVTSFSTLTREKHAHGAMPAPVVRTPAQTPPDAPVAPVAPLFLDAPGGAVVGTAVHDWIEGWDFGVIDAEALQRHLAGARLPAPAEGRPDWAQVLTGLFTDLREIRLPGTGGRPLRELCPEPYGSEWHFHLPLNGGLSVGDLARCFAEHAAPEHRSYARLLETLSEERFSGLLQGFIDRLVRDGPVWGVVDWKTNRLGPALADYDHEALLRCAREDHYLLQTHLYLVALRRYLRALGVAEATVAGAWLVFLRAIRPGDSRGVLHIDPPAEMLDALERFFAAGEGASS